MKKEKTDKWYFVRLKNSCSEKRHYEKTEDEAQATKESAHHYPSAQEFTFRTYKLPKLSNKEKQPNKMVRIWTGMNCWWTQHHRSVSNARR